MRRWLRFGLKSIAILIGAAVLTVAAFLFIYDWVNLRPHVGGIRQSLAQMPAEDRTPPEQVVQLVHKFIPNERDRDWQVVRRLRTHDATQTRERMLYWHINGFLWTYLLQVHFNSEERMALFLNDMQFEAGNGLTNSAKYYFHKSPHELSEDEVLTLLVISRGPQMYSPSRHPESLQREVDAWRQRIAAR